MNTLRRKCYVRACLEVKRHEDMEDDRTWAIRAQFDKSASATWMIKSCFCKVI